MLNATSTKGCHVSTLCSDVGFLHTVLSTPEKNFQRLVNIIFVFVLFCFLIFQGSFRSDVMALLYVDKNQQNQSE